MRRLTKKECEGWLKERGIPDPTDRQPAGSWAKAAFGLPAESSRKVWFCTQVLSRFGEEGERLVWFRDWPFAGDHERAVLESLGEARRSLVDAPGFHFPADSAKVAGGLFEVGCLLGIDTVLAGHGGGTVILVDHHEIGIILSRDVEQLGHLVHELLEGGLRRIEG